jgi:fucose permease
MDQNVWTVALGLSGAFGLGMCFASLGSIAVKLMPRMNMDQAKFGSLVSTFMFSCLIASLAVGAGMDALGYKLVAIIGFLAAGVSLFLLGNARSPKAAMIAGILLGVGAMACNQTGNVLGTAAIVNTLGWGPAAANNLVNVFFGLGLFLMPFMVSFLFQKTSYEKAISALGVVVIIPVVFAFLAGYPEAAGFSLVDAVKMLSEPVTIVASLLLFCYIALESSFTNWLAPYGKEVVSKESPDMDGDKVDASAARLLSAFAVAMMAGRLIASLSGVTAIGSWLIAICAALATVVIFVMMGVSKGSAAFALAAVAGFVFGPAFPTTVGVTFAKFGGGSGSLFGIMFAVGLAGAVIVPKAIGNAAKGSSVQKSLKLLIPIAIALVVLAVVLNFVKGPAESAAAGTDAVDKIEIEEVVEEAVEALPAENLDE